MKDDNKIFRGFELPKQNWSKLPHELIDQLHRIETLGELACIIYVLRHTWGYQEFGKEKKITIDEFMNGRKRKDGTRIDGGTGLSNPTVINGLSKAVSDGFLKVVKDDRDEGRKKRFYMLNMAEIAEEEPDAGDEPDVEDRYKETLHQPKEVLHQPKDNLHRTEKDTIRKDTTGNNLYIETPKSTSKRRDGLTPDIMSTIEGFAMLSAQAESRGKAWKGRHLFESDDRIAFLADKVVKLFGVPMAKDLPVLLAQVNNLVSNNVTPDDLQNAYNHAKNKWTTDVTGLSDGLIRIARTKAIERIGVTYADDETNIEQDSEADDELVNAINRG